MEDEFEYCEICKDPLLDEDVIYEGACNECGDAEQDEEDNKGMKWGCNECKHEWEDGHFVTYIECPKCSSEDMGHY